MIFQTESQLKEHGNKLPDEKKKAIDHAIKALKKAHESKDVDKIKSELEKVNEAWKNASEELYKAQAENQPQANPSDQKKSSKKDDNDDVQDVDFEEVK
jgi:molecular chaperone DnaK